MPGRIRRDDIEALRERVELADVVSDHTRLQRAGQRLKGLCPFHQEKTPSFTVDPQRGLYHCFGCQAGGDVFTFVQEIEGTTFVEAVEQLARRVGMELHYEDLSPGERRALGERSRLLEVTAAAQRFFRAQLASDAGQVARDYLAERGFDGDDADRFQLGFAPDQWEALSRHLQGQHFAPEEIVRAGVAVRTRRGGLGDRFRGRLVFPVFDVSGEVIGFGGRILPGLDYRGSDPPKYLNTPETPLYRKHRVLYGLNWARPEIVRAGEALVCEGYTDVMALHRAGFGTAVATCGTAVGAEHLRLLERYASRVILAFDADEAGGRAAERVFELSRERDLDVRVLVLPPGRDPADLVRAGGSGAVSEQVAAATPIVPFVLRRRLAAHELDTPEGRARAVAAAAPVLAGVADPVLQHEYARREVADAVGLSLDVVRRAVAQAGADIGGVAPGGAAAGTRAPAGGTALGDGMPAATDGARRAGRRGRRGPDRAVARARLEREVLRVVLQEPRLLPDRWSEVTESDFTHPKARAVYRAVDAAGGAGAGVVAVTEAAEDDDVRALVRSIALEELTVVPDRDHAAMLVNRLLLPRLEAEIAGRKAELERLNPTTDPDAYRTRFEQLVALEARRRDLRAVEE